MDILFVTSMTVWGGGEEWFQSMARGLVRRGHRVVFVCQPTGAVRERLSSEDFEVIPMQIRGELEIPTYVRFARLFRNRNFDVALVARSREAKIVGAAAKIARGPAVVRVYGNMKKIPNNLIYRFTYQNLVPRILAPSAAICNLLLTECPWLPADSVRCIPIGVDPARGGSEDPAADRARVRAELDLPADLPIIASIGRLAPIKGHKYFIEALARLQASPNGVSQARGLIVGDGDLKNELVAHARQVGIEHRLKMAGFRKDVGAVLAASDIVAMPSLSEGFPLAVLEAMMAGRPIVASRVGGIPEMIIDGENGLLVPPADSGALAHALAWLISEPGLRKRMGEAARERALREFHRPRMLDRLEAYLSEVTPHGVEAPVTEPAR